MFFVTLANAFVQYVELVLEITPSFAPSVTSGIWVHKKYSGMTKIQFTPDYVCRKCAGEKDVPLIDGRPFKEVQVGDSTLRMGD